MFYAGSSFGLLVFTPKQSTVIYGNDHTLDLWNFIWPSVLIDLRLLVYLIRVHRSLYPSSSSEEGSYRCIASECHLEKWAQGSRSWTASSTLWSQFLIFPSRKRLSAQSAEAIQRPSAQSAEGNQSPIVRNAEGMESPFVRKPKARAYLCELKSRKSPKRSPFVRKAEGMESPIVHNAKGILIYLKNIVLSSKNDVGIVGV